MDFSYSSSHKAEKGRGCVEFWLGMAAERGIKIVIPQKSSLMDACQPQQERFYGYDTLNIEAYHEDDRIKIAFTEVEKLPTAEEIEAKYDHAKSTVPEHLLEKDE